MLKVQSIDMRGIGNLLSGIHNALIGTGAGGDLKEVVTDETRKLALECGSAPTPRARKKQEMFVHRDIGRVFLARPAQPFTGDKAKGDGVTWLTAGPNFLTGIPDDRMLYNRVSIAGGGAKSILYNSRSKSFTLGPKWIEVGRHGKQHVMFANRFMVGRGVIRDLFSAIKKRIGIRDASFAETASKLGATNLPARTTAHFPTKHSTTRLDAINSAKPEIVFGSDAKGVAGLAAKVKSAVAVREKKMRFRLNLILTGYANDNKSRSTIKRHAK